jgi:hypothetical protein
VRAAALLLVLASLALTACESSQEKNAKLEKIVKREAAEAKRHGVLGPRGLTITHQSTKVKVVATDVLHSSEGTAAVVTLHNMSSTALREVPIKITVQSASGAAIYSNDTPGLAAALVAVPLIPAHASTTWIDDQVQAAGVPARLAAEVGEGEPVIGAIPRLNVESTHLAQGTSGIEGEGKLVNSSGVAQRELVLYAIARRAGRIVAAGRALIPQAEAGSSTRFQVFFIGDPRGAQLEVSAPPSTFG